MSEISNLQLKSRHLPTSPRVWKSGPSISATPPDLSGGTRGSATRTRSPRVTTESRRLKERRRSLARMKCNYGTTERTDRNSKEGSSCMKWPRSGADLAVGCRGLSPHLQTTVNIQSMFVLRQTMNREKSVLLTCRSVFLRNQQSP